MKKITMCIVCIMLTTQFLQGQVQDANYTQLSNQISDLKSQNDGLNSLLRTQAGMIKELIENGNLTAISSWNLIKNNIRSGVEGYIMMNNKVTILKDKLIDADYNSYIMSLGSLNGNPLGFSFKDEILKTAKEKVIFTKQNNADKFINTIKAISASPLIALIPYASQAASISNSVLNVAYSAGIQNEKVDLEKIQQFETHLNNYLSYYSALDKANNYNSQNTQQFLTLLEVTQRDLLSELKSITKSLDITVSVDKVVQSVDDSLYSYTTALSDIAIKGKLDSIELKYVNIPLRLNSVNNLKVLNNNMETIKVLRDRVKSIYESRETTALSYSDLLEKALKIAYDNNIIRSNNGSSSSQTYEDIKLNLIDKKRKRDASSRWALKIWELDTKIKTLNLVKVL